ncbi:MAG: response regulator, partial [Gammaproteobacteria bacterium]|nr:response regulator [Gammaproteobacteria bacterium]
MLSTAYDGLTALAMIEDSPPDLILLDVMMPGLDGYEVTHRLKTNPSTKGIPIILVTALNDPDDRARGLESGAEDFLTKPINPEEIEARIQSMLKLKRYQNQLAIRSHSENKIFGNDPFADLPETSAHQPRILIVDDDIKDIKMLHYHLDDKDYNLSVVNNGSDAIEAISCQHF